MANFRLQIVPPGAGFPTRIDTEEEAFDFELIHVGPDKLEITQDGSGLTARLKLVNNLVIPQAVNDDEVARWDQVKTFVADNLGTLEWQPSVISVIGTPPLSPIVGDRYLINDTTTGAWIGHEWQIAEWSLTGWVYTSCTFGTFVYVDTIGEFYVKANINWTLKSFDNITASTGVVRVLNDIQLALKGVTTDKIADHAVDNLQLATNAVATTNVQDNAITNDKMADNSVNTTELVDNAVTNAKMADNSVGTAELINDSVTGDKIPDGAVNTEHIYGGAITNAKLAANSVATGNIQNSAITNDLMADNSVGTAELVDNAVTNAKMADNSVNTAELVDNAVTNAKMADNSVGTAELIDNAVTNSKMADNSVNTAELVDNAVTNAKMADNSVNTAELVDNAVTNPKLGSAAVTGNKILAAIKNRVGVATDTTMETYTSTQIINQAHNYPQALSALDSFTSAALLSLALEEIQIVINPAGITSLTCTTLSWIYSADALDITVRVNGKLLTQSTTANPVEEFTKTSTNTLSFNFTVPYGSKIVVRKERTGGASGDTILVVKDAGVPVNSVCKVVNFQGSGVVVTNVGINEINVTITAGSGGIDLGNVMADIIPFNDNDVSLGSNTKGWKALYLTDQATGDKYRLEMNDGYLQAVLEP